MNRRIKWIAAAAAAAIAAGPASAGTNHQWGDYHWYSEGGDVPLTIKYKFRDQRWLSYHQTSLQVWNDNSASPLALTDGGENGATSTKKCDPISGRVVIVCSDNYGNRGWLGIASITAVGTHITTATVKYNDTYYASGAYNTPDQRNFVTCHEVGHTFGLGHLDTTFDNPNKESCMDYTSNPAGPPDNRIPGPIDWATLNSATMYGAGHGDSGGDPAAGGGDGGDGGGGGGPPPGKGPKFDPFEFRQVGRPAPSADPIVSDDWGRAVAFDAQGRPSVFEREVGPRSKKITHVTWLPGFRPQRHHMSDD